MTLLQTVEPILRTFLSVTSIQLHTRSIGWQKCLEIGKGRCQIRSWKSIIPNIIASLSRYTSYYVTTTAFLILSINFKLQNAQWPNEYSVHKIIPDTHLTCKLNVTVKLYRARWIFHDADPHFYTKQNNRVRAVCFMSVPMHNNIYVRKLGYQKKILQEI